MNFENVIMLAESPARCLEMAGSNTPRLNQWNALSTYYAVQTEAKETRLWQEHPAINTPLHAFPLICHSYRTQGKHNPKKSR